MTGDERLERPAASHETESPARLDTMMEAICQRENMTKAWKQVRSNNGSGSVDGLTIAQTQELLTL